MGTIANLIVRIGADISDLEQGLSRAREGSNALLVGVTAVTAGITALGISSIVNASKLEQTRVAFTTMIGSAEKANSLLKDMQDFASSTPFELTEIQDAGKKLLAFGVTADDIIPTMKKLGDVSSGVGAPIGEIAELYGKAKTQGRLFAEDINQLTGRGIPIIKELAKQFGVNEDQVKNLVESGQIGFPQLSQAFDDMTASGSQFGGMMDSQSKTLGGLWSNLLDNIGQTSVVFGQSLIDSFNIKGLVSDAVTWLGTLKDALQNGGIQGAFDSLIPTSIKEGIFILSGAILGALVPAFAGLAVSIWTAVAPLSPFLIAGGLLGALGFTIYENWGWIVENFPAIADAFTEAGKSFNDAVTWFTTGQAEASEAYNKYGDEIQRTSDANKTAWSNFFDKIHGDQETLKTEDSDNWFWKEWGDSWGETTVQWNQLMTAIAGFATNVVVEWQTFGDIFNDEVNNLKEKSYAIDIGFIKLTQDIGDGFNTAGAVVQSVGQGIGDALMSANTVVSGAFDGINTGLIAVGGFFQWLWSTVVGVAQGIGDSVSSAGIVVSDVGGGIGLTLNTTGGFFQWFGGVIQGVGDWFNGVIGFMGASATNAGATITNAMNGAGDWWQAQFANVWAWFQNMPGELLDIGTRAIQGFWQGIINAKDQVIQGVGDFAQSVMDKFRQMFDSHSDSKEMIDLGYDVAHGLITGINGVNILGFINNMVKDALAKFGDLTNVGKLLFPTATTTITSPFGSRDAPTAGASSYHGGIDIGAGYGEAVNSVGGGRVIQAGDMGTGYGNSIQIDLGNGLTSLFGHLSSVAVSVGDIVKAGQTVGAVGSTGISTGPHLHYSLFKDGVAVDPETETGGGADPALLEILKMIANAMANGIPISVDGRDLGRLITDLGGGGGGW